MTNRWANAVCPKDASSLIVSVNTVSAYHFAILHKGELSPTRMARIEYPVLCQSMMILVSENQATVLANINVGIDGGFWTIITSACSSTSHRIILSTEATCHTILIGALAIHGSERRVRGGLAIPFSSTSGSLVKAEMGGVSVYPTTFVLYPCEMRDFEWYIMRGERPISPRTKTMADLGLTGLILILRTKKEVMRIVCPRSQNRPRMTNGPMAGKNGFVWESVKGERGIYEVMAPRAHGWNRYTDAELGSRGSSWHLRDLARIDKMSGDDRADHCEHERHVSLAGRDRTDWTRHVTRLQSGFTCLYPK